MEQVPCDICGDAPMRVVRPIGGTHIMRCRRCGLAFLNPRPSAEELSRYYESDYYESDDPLAHGYEDYEALAPALEHMAAQKVALVRSRLTGGKLLDVGAGFGHFVQAARRAGFDANGIEVSPVGARFARERLDAPVTQGTLDSVDAPPGAFDAITLWDVLEHVHSARTALDQVGGLLRPGGYVFLTVPDADGLLARLMGPKWFGYQKIDHTYYFTPRTIRKLLSASGFSDVECRMGSWSCSVEYIARRLAHYHRLLADCALAFCDLLAITSGTIDFRLIDMLVVARREVR